MRDMREFRHILARLGAIGARAGVASRLAGLVQRSLRLSIVIGLLLIAFFYFFPLYGGVPPILLPPFSPPLPDPLPLRRVLVNPEQMPAELERARQGILQEIPRAEFEGRVQRAALAVEAIKSPPRIIEARYRATLNEAGLVGTAQCTILHTLAAPGILTLQPFSLALRKATLDGSEAILGDLDGKSLGILIEHFGKHTLALDWSARSDPGPNGLHFELKVPPCALTSFELDLPEGRTPALARDGCLLSGPLPGSARSQAMAAGVRRSGAGRSGDSKCVGPGRTSIAPTGAHPNQAIPVPGPRGVEFRFHPGSAARGGAGNLPDLSAAAHSSNREHAQLNHRNLGSTPGRSTGRTVHLARALA